MKREEQIVFCRKCLNRKMDFKQGLLCNLTNEKATFHNECDDFKIDETLKEKKIIELEDVSAFDPPKKVRNGVGVAGFILSFLVLSYLCIIVVFMINNIIFNFSVTQSYARNFLDLLENDKNLVISIFFFFIASLLSVSISIVGLFKKPKTFAVLGLVISLITTVVASLVYIYFEIIFFE